MQQRQTLFRPSPVNVMEEEIATAKSVLGDDADLPPPAAIVTMSAQFNDNSQLSSPSSVQPIAARLAPPSMLDKAWTLVDKYHIDCTFHVQDWNEVKTTYNAKVMSALASHPSS